MRTIQKNISLEPITSRLPSVWPAYYDDELLYFDDDSLEDREWQYTSNWGMVPANIVINHDPSSLDDDGKKYECSAYTVTSDECSGFTLSFESISKWYYFFNEYYNLLKKYSHCNRVYTSAEDYYKYESLDKYSDQMIYGTDKQTYLDLDEEFSNMGGIVEVLTFNKKTSEISAMTPSEAHDEENGDVLSMIDVYDIGFFKWLCDNVVPFFIIPAEYKDYWKRDRLFYPDVVKWLAWFGQRLHYEDDANYNSGFSGDISSWDCKESAVTENGDCCDCEEYFNRGGKRIYDKMKDWYSDKQETIKTNNSKMPISGTCHIPTVIIPTELQVSIDDLGQFSIFSTDYELGKDYRVSDGYGQTANTNSGTVVTIDGKSIILKEGSGYTFDQYYMGKYVSSCSTCGYEGVFYDICPKCGSKDTDIIGWDSYTERYISNNKDEFYVPSAFTYYTFDDNNVKHTSSTEDELRESLIKHYPITKGDWLIIDGELYEIAETEYGIYDTRNKYLGGKKYLVFRDNGTNTPYTYINGKKIFAEYYLPTNVFYFPFFLAENASFNESCSGKTFNIKNYKQFKRVELNDDKMLYIEYDGKTYEISGDAIDISGKDAYTISAYTISHDYEMLYCLSGSSDVLYDNNGLRTYPNSSANTETVDVLYSKELQSYRVDEITGKTVSKIYDLRLYNTLTDDIGNTIDGIYDMFKNGVYNHQPPEGEPLEPIYQVGNTANITRFSKTKDDIDDIKDERNYFVGDIITEMDFYYKNYTDEIEKSTIYSVILDTDDKFYIHDFSGGVVTNVVSGYTSLSAINYSTDAKVELEENNILCKDDIYCDITYYIGATLSRKKGKTYNLANKEDSRGDLYSNHGVEYKETVKFVNTNVEYYLKKPSDSSSTIPSKRNNPCKHSVSYPICVYVLTQDLTRVEDSQYDSDYNVALASFKVDIDVFSGNGDTYSIKYGDEMCELNNLQVFPTFRQEYKIGTSVIENIDSDIYIDRGINPAYEKHLKLGEITSLEALEQYGNGFFKIMEN